MIGRLMPSGPVPESKDNPPRGEVLFRPVRRRTRDRRKVMGHLQQRRAWLASLKPGDEVAVWNGHYHQFATVDRLTPSGRMADCCKSSRR